MTVFSDSMSWFFGSENFRTPNDTITEHTRRDTLGVHFNNTQIFGQDKLYNSVLFFML